MSSGAFNILIESSLTNLCFSLVTTVHLTDPSLSGAARVAEAPLRARLTLYTKLSHIGSILSKPGAAGVVTFESGR